MKGKKTKLMVITSGAITYCMTSAKGSNGLRGINKVQSQNYSNKKAGKNYRLFLG